jgi:hypothetical protein
MSPAPKTVICLTLSALASSCLEEVELCRMAIAGRQLAVLRLIVRAKFIERSDILLIYLG